MTQYINREQLEDYNTRCITALCMYFTLVDAQPHHQKLGEWKEMFYFLNYELQAEIVIPAARDHDYYWYPDVDAPDICATCYHSFGWTLGGRIREGCMHCHDDGSLVTQYFFNQRDSMYINNAHCEYLFACALYIWSKAAPRNKQQTAKYLTDNDLYITDQVPVSEYNYASS